MILLFFFSLSSLLRTPHTHSSCHTHTQEHSSCLSTQRGVCGGGGVCKITHCSRRRASNSKDAACDGCGNRFFTPLHLCLLLLPLFLFLFFLLLLAPEQRQSVLQFSLFPPLSAGRWETSTRHFVTLTRKSLRRLHCATATIDGRN